MRSAFGFCCFHINFQIWSNSICFCYTIRIQGVLLITVLMESLRHLCGVIACVIKITEMPLVV